MTPETNPNDQVFAVIGHGCFALPTTVMDQTTIGKLKLLGGMSGLNIDKGFTIVPDGDMTNVFPHDPQPKPHITYGVIS